MRSLKGILVVTAVMLLATGATADITTEGQLAGHQPPNWINQTTLYNQTANYGGSLSSVQNFEAAYDAYDAEGADDFVVTWADGWSIEQVGTIAGYWNGVGPAASVKVVPPVAKSLTAGKAATAEHVFYWPASGITKAMNGPLSAVDGKLDTGWCSRPATREQSDEPRWLDVDLGAPTTVAGGLVAASRALGSGPNTIQAFVVQYKKGDEWVTCFDSKTILGVALKRWTHPIKFAPVTARHFRLGVLGRNTYIREFQLFAPR